MKYNEYRWEVYMNSWKTAVIFFLIILCYGCAVGLEGSAPGPEGKAVICHKGKKTISVGESAVKAHLGHGDYMGVCQ
jgi:hypothetical protein